MKIINVTSLVNTSVIGIGSYASHTRSLPEKMVYIEDNDGRLYQVNEVVTGSGSQYILNTAEDAFKIQEDALMLKDGECQCQITGGKRLAFAASLYDLATALNAETNNLLIEAQIYLGTGASYCVDGSEKKLLAVQTESALPIVELHVSPAKIMPVFDACLPTRSKAGDLSHAKYAAKLGYTIEQIINVQDIAAVSMPRLIITL